MRATQSHAQCSASAGELTKGRDQISLHPESHSNLRNHTVRVPDYIFSVQSNDPIPELTSALESHFVSEILRTVGTVLLTVILDDDLRLFANHIETTNETLTIVESHLKLEKGVEPIRREAESRQRLHARFGTEPSEPQRLAQSDNAPHWACSTQLRVSGGDQRVSLVTHDLTQEKVINRNDEFLQAQEPGSLHERVNRRDRSHALVQDAKVNPLPQFVPHHSRDPARTPGPSDRNMQSLARKNRATIKNQCSGMAEAFVHSQERRKRLRQHPDSLRFEHRAFPRSTQHPHPAEGPLEPRMSERLAPRPSLTCFAI